MQTEVPEGWTSTRISDFAWEVNERCSNGDTEVLSVTKYDGFVPSLEYFGKQVFSKDVEKYKLVRQGQFAYATIHLEEGSIDNLRIRDKGIISPMYTVFDIKTDQVDRQFLLELLRTPSMLDRYGAIGQGSINRRKSISFETLGAESIPLPPLPEQRKIAAVLGSVDGAIQATEAVIAQTRRVKEGLLQELLTKGIGHTRFKQTEIGEIPEAWELAPLAATLIDGPRNGVYKSADEIGRGVIIVGQTAFTEDRRVDFDATRRATASAEDLARYTLADGDILVTRVYATPDGCGRPVLVDGVTEPAIYESNMMRMRVDTKKVLPSFLFHWLQIPAVRRYLMARASSSNQTSINQATLGKVPCALPALSEQASIIEAIEALIEAIGFATDELDVYRETKSGLLQDLLTGKKRVGNSE